MNKLRVTALLLAVILAVGGIVLKICGYDAQTDFEPTLPLLIPGLAQSRHKRT